MSAGGAPGDQRLGSAAEEAAKLFAALQDWAQRAGGGEPGGGEEAAGRSGVECRLCPFCQLLGVLRASRPEVVEHLADAAASLAAAARAAVLASERDWAARRPSGVEHIDIG